MAKRRGQNEGTITKRKDGRWEARITTGYNKRKCFYGKTRLEVQEKLTASLHSCQQGMPTLNDRNTVGEFLKTWLSEIVSDRVRPRTFVSYEQITRNHLVPGLGKEPLSKLTPQQVSAFLKQKHDSGINAEHLRRVLRIALNQALRWELVTRNSASLAACPKRAKAEIKFLDVDQVRKFIAAVDGHKHQAMFTVVVAVGLRFGEALGLKWEDINFETGTLSVRRQLQKMKGTGFTFSEPKTRRALRTLPLPKFALDALIGHRLQQEFQAKALAGDRWKDHGLVFTSEVGTPADDRNVRRSLAAILKVAQLPALRFHDLRHSCATLLLAQGVDARTIMETLGHSQISLTLDTYAHVLPSLQREAAEKMQNIFVS